MTLDLSSNVARKRGANAGGCTTLIAGRYALHGPLAAGGMATVHFGRLVGSAGFRRTVAIKRLHAHLARETELVEMLLDEGRLAARIHHPNVVGTLDFVEENGELFLVLEYVAGLSVSALAAASATTGDRLRPAEAVAILVGTLHGLHAAHEALSATGEPLALVHRDVSPQNILVGEDGVARVIDFGIAKAVERVRATKGNDLNGKIAYMAPEQLLRAGVDRRTDIYAAAIVLWELLTGRRYIDGPNTHPAAKINIALTRQPEPPSRYRSDIPAALDEVVMKALAHDPDQRFATALEMACALDSALVPASQREVGEWVSRVGGEKLQIRAAELRRIESADSDPRDLPPDPGSGVRLAKKRPPVAAAVVVVAEPQEHVATESLSRESLPDDAPNVGGVFAAMPIPGGYIAPLVRTPHQLELESSPALVLPRTEPPATTRRYLSAMAIAGVFILAIIGFVAAQRPASGQAAAQIPILAAAPPPPAAMTAPVLTAVPVQTAAPPPPPVKARPAVAAKKARPPTTPSCDPPFTIDHGIQIPKPECL